MPMPHRPKCSISALSSRGSAAAQSTTCVGMAVKWFPDRRGLAVGLTAAGYGAGAALTVIPIRYVIDTFDYNTARSSGSASCRAPLFCPRLAASWAGSRQIGGGTCTGGRAVGKGFSPKEVLLSPIFWLLYVMFVMVSASGLMATAQIAPIAGDFKVGNEIVFWGATTLTAALIIDNLANGAARPLFGWISDNIGRELTMAIAFGLGGLSYWLLGSLGTAPWAFVLFAALIFLTWGEIFSLFPSTCTDTFESAVRDGEPRPAVYRQGDIGFSGAGRKPDQISDRQLAHGVRCHRADELRGRRLGAFSYSSQCGHALYRRSLPEQNAEIGCTERARSQTDN